MLLQKSSYAAETGGVYIDVVNLSISAGWIISNPLLSCLSLYFTDTTH